MVDIGIVSNVDARGNTSNTKQPLRATLLRYVAGHPFVTVATSAIITTPTADRLCLMLRPMSNTTPTYTSCIMAVDRLARRCSAAKMETSASCVTAIECQTSSTLDRLVAANP